MFNLKSQNELDEPINAILREMALEKPHTQEYTKLLDQLTKLYEIKDTKSKDRVSKDTLALVFGNLAGIAMIVGYEHMNALSSKAINFVMKPKA